MPRTTLAAAVLLLAVLAMRSPQSTGAFAPSEVARVRAHLVGIAKGAPNFHQSGSRRTLGFVNAGAGAVSAAFGVHRLTGKRSTVSPVSFAPWFSGSGVPGLSGRITF